MTPQEARFCRHCGGAIVVGRRATEQNLGGPTVSPLAATIPLPTAAAPSPANSAVDPAHRRGSDSDDTFESTEADKASFDLDAQLAAGQPFLADEYGHVVTPENDPDLEAFLKTPDFIRPDSGEDDDDEATLVTIPVWHPARTTASAAAGQSSVNAASSSPPRLFEETATTIRSAAPATVALPVPSGSGNNARAVERRALGVWLGASLIALLVLGLGAGVFGVWYLTRSLRQQQPPLIGNSAEPVASAAPVADPGQLSRDKIAEADQLLTAGDTEAALARLREAVALDAANAEAYRRLARLLLARGSRGEAIAAFQSVVGLEPNDVESWQQLVTMQFAEGLYREAVSSYERLLANTTTNGTPPDARTQLSYADALRLSGRPAEARPVYQRLASSVNGEIAGLSRRRLAQLADGAADENDNRAGRANEQGDDDTVAGQPPAAVIAGGSVRPVVVPTATQPKLVETPERQQLSPAARYERGASLWVANRGAALAEFRAAATAGHADAYYYLGLSMAENREPKDLSRAELVAALNYFQHARAGRFSNQARGYEERLGKEYDKRRKQ